MCLSEWLATWGSHPLQDALNDEAYEGYDNLLFIGRSMKRYGTGFVKRLGGDNQEYLSTRFDIQPIMDDTDVESKKIEYYENQNLRIIQFIENQFQILR